MTAAELVGRRVEVLDDRGQSIGFVGLVSPWVRHTAAGEILEVSAAGRRVEVSPDRLVLTSSPLPKGARI